ncbi:MAG: heavy metal transporter [Bacteroidota bacterium]
MTKIIRKTYPKEISIGILIIIAVVTFFLSGQLFEKRQPEFAEALTIYFGEFLVTLTVMLMVLILWEEILFPVHIKPEDDGLVFRNHRTKLKIQAVIYLIIPLIVVFIYMTYNVSVYHFFGYAAVVMLLPVIGKLVSGINNYNDFLKMTSHEIQYKNNEKEGTFLFSEISKLKLIKDNDNILSKLLVEFKSGEPVTIDLDEMELDAYYEAIEEYVTTNHKPLL